MGESTLSDISPSFNKSIKVNFGEQNLTSHSGSLLIRETMEATGIMKWLASRMKDPRKPNKIKHSLTEILHTYMLLLCQGLSDQQDTERVTDDPAMLVSNKTERGAKSLLKNLPSQPTLSRALGVLSSRENLRVLNECVFELARRRIILANNGKKKDSMIIDVDGLPVQTEGHQPGSVYNGHYRKTIYHTLVASNAEEGDMFGGVVRPGNVSSKNGAVEFIRDLVERCKKSLSESITLRMDAGFCDGDMCGELEGMGVEYMMRIKSNNVLETMAAPWVRHRNLLTCYDEHGTWCEELEYGAKSWNRKRRVILVMVKSSEDFFITNHFFLVTSLGREYSVGDVLALYRKRGKTEAHMGEMMDVLNPSLSSSPREKSHYRGKDIEREKTEEKREEDKEEVYPQNQALFLLNLLAYEVMHTGRCLIEDVGGRGFSLRRYRERVLLCAARVARSARRIVFTVARSGKEYWLMLWEKLSTMQWVGA